MYPLRETHEKSEARPFRTGKSSQSWYVNGQRRAGPCHSNKEEPTKTYVLLLTCKLDGKTNK